MRILLALATILAFAIPASADECVPSTSDPEISVAGFYIDNDLCQVPPGEPTSWTTPRLFDWYGGGGGGGACIFSIWWYQESNDIPGLQRGDEVHDDTCRGLIESDSLAFF